MRRPIPALKVRQWLADWNEIHWKPKEHRSEPPRWFFQFTIRATELKALTGVYRRTTERISAADDLGIQRRHEVTRSREISRFVRFGYPWSNLTVAKRKSSEFGDLRQPGWLPTAIVVNILTPDQKRNGTYVSPDDLIDIADGEPAATLLLPANFRGDHWRFQSIPPIEVIDGQHRLWAFENDHSAADFEVPVVAFQGLDLSWQAYLFYTINIKPKKINPSIAFDLYPLLRTEDWLSKSEGHPIYRESRAQEIVDILWKYTGSPWFHRINMLGEPGKSGLQVTQAAWVRSLMASFIKPWEGKRVQIGGLFGTCVGRQKTVLPWTCRQQAAFVILAGNKLRDAIRASNDEWAVALRESGSTRDGDPAFIGRNNLLNQDQGIRALLQTVNDLHFVCADDIELDHLPCDEEPDASDEQAITAVLDCFLTMEKLVCFLNQVTAQIAAYDWRSSRAPGLTDDQQVLKAGFRGSGGYRDLRADLLRHLVLSETTLVPNAAKQVMTVLGY